MTTAVAADRPPSPGRGPGAAAATVALVGLLGAATALGLGPPAVAGLAALWAAVVLPALARPTALRVVETAVLAVPFVLAAARGGPVQLPFAALAVAFAVALAAVVSTARVRAAAVAVTTVAVGLAVLLPAVGVESPRLGSALAATGPRPAATERGESVPPAWREAEGEATRRVGALARVAGDPSGARWRAVPPGARARLPAGEPAGFVVGARSLAGEGSGRLRLVDGALPPHPLDLDAFDVLVWLPTPEAPLDDRAQADLAESFARRGGLLVGPAPPQPWPAVLARRLATTADVGEAGPAGTRPYGAGRVARAGSQRELEALLDAGRHLPRVATAFDRALAAPAVAPGWGEPPGPPDPASPLLGVGFGLAACAAALLPGWRRTAVLVAAAALASAAISATTTAPPAARVDAFRIDLAGHGGRRVEGLLVAAGPSGWVQEGPLRGAEHGLRLLGFRRVAGEPDRLALPPGGRGWIVEESVAGDPASGLATVHAVPGWARPLLVWRALGPSDVRMREGVAEYGGPRVDGLAVPTSARALAVLP